MFMQDVQACAVNRLHSLGITHRDIKLVVSFEELHSLPTCEYSLSFRLAASW